MAIDSIVNSDKLKSVLVGNQAQPKDRAQPESRGAQEEQGKGAESSVHITPTAAALLTAESKLQNLPVVDKERVEAIRSKIAQGKLEINAERIAEKMIALEGLIDSKLGDR
ncbi:MAG: flagellar biosynthesis anti-sigma factor FlgM [Gammaproteobacteria bacterium]|nr:flagellar biosynthesis anti-sigma factor FlgM [Gammaproteobacteria bacterium]MDH5694546.1 flagellar biosynthesis anti-sigma factor FlgM [Gammaproteobacteria bacterium]